ncbi:MAG TPA: glycosyltransferase, partial [Candidatus Limnocylindrales bacterium]|nr:glycosyltransferase [Candidatus Limnocylindrales bacterium]
MSPDAATAEAATPEAGAEAGPPEAARPRIDVLVVASWFPAYDDAAAGRFVADQAEAVAATGAARVSVVSFDAARLSGGAAARARQAKAVLRAGVAGVGAAEPLFVAPAWGVEPTLPVARLTISDGQTAATGSAHGSVHRAALLDALGRQLLATGAAGSHGVVHAHTVYPDGAAAVALADRLGWPLVVTEHSSFVAKIVSNPAQRDAYARTLRRAHRTLAVSEMLAGELRAAFPDEADRIEVLPNAVPLDHFEPGDPAARVPDELLFVGYRKATKGIENLLRAVAAARDRRPSIRLRLLGRAPDIPTEARWLDLVEKLGLIGFVTFEDPVDRAGIGAAMRRASLFVHPSPRETFGVVAVEALASGLPVVATDSGGVTEILGPDPGALGAIVPIDDPAALATAIVEALERRETFEPEALRAAVERRFGAVFVAERLLVVYREALGAQAAAADPAQSVPTAAGAPQFGRVVVVALDRARAALRLRPLPDGLRARIDLVTSSEPLDIDLPIVRSVTEVSIDTDWRPPVPAGRPRRGLAGRLERLATDPIGTVLRRLGRGAGSEVSLRPATVAIERLVA